MLASTVAVGMQLEANAQAPTRTTLSGTIHTDSGDPLPGATIFVKGTFLGGSSNNDGRFVFPVEGISYPAVLTVSFIGYETQQVNLDGPNPNGSIEVTLQPSVSIANEVVVSASRVEENILRAPVTVEKLTTPQVGRITTPDLLSGLAQYKGIDLNSASMLTTSISTRGFNSAKSERVIQMVDYMDTQSPSLNLNLGNGTGLPEVDVASVEVIHGPASALYGANAFNGVVLTNSKDPFTTEGLTVRLRGGQRSMLDGQIRYAKRLSQKLAFKITGSYFTANDWIANNYAATSSVLVPQNNAANSDLGYDAVNRYGDVGNTYTASAGALKGKTAFMPGWSERELIANDNKARLYRINPSISYLITDRVKATLDFKRSEGTSSYQSASRYRFKNFGTDQYRAEVKSDNWFVRAYQTQDFGHDSYDMGFLGAFMQNSIDPRQVNADGTPKRNADGSGITYAQGYFTQYAQTYNTYLASHNGDVRGAEAAARAAAAPYQLTASSPEFVTLRKAVSQDATPGQGARLNPSSFLNDVSGQYNFKFSSVDLIVGGAYREFRLGSDGKLFSDSDGKRIHNFEYGGYAQASRQLFADHLKLAIAGRVDDFKNFKPAFSPRASAVLSLGDKKQHNFRTSYGQAFRSPTQLDQYIRLDVGRAVLLGNAGNGFEGLSTADAVTPVSIQALKLEQVKTYEIGYKGLLSEKLVLDINYYRSRYNHFIGARQFIGNLDGTRPSQAQVAVAAPKQFQDAGLSTRVIQAWTNADQEVNTQGAAASLSYSVDKMLSLTGNYTLNLLSEKNLPSGFQTFFNTPKHKYNVGAFGDINRQLSYTVNYRWAQGHHYELPFAVGQLGSYSSLDAQVSYTIPAISTTVQVGGSNLANSRNIQVYGGPQIGRLAYLGLLVNLK
ncbi:TonB-dependent receptor [Hymenobacter sp. GOD-10R]|uniref:TonB-dependent receptor n=1 Tax=Hymenobacter sp. GOD-10R TaxID=3093922 RepID=UPI002D78BFC8|nr:TonB-dependent receptor [Hymenobacter sp. GOD-10R]WRQ28256.1 TonB-dependent receptor [Hymenobacter sp. GOD-10R]